MLSSPPSGPLPVPHRRGLWWTRRACLSHVALVIWVPGCLIAGWWQVTVALSGDSLGWLYSVEWPVFAIFGIVGWWHVIHDDPETTGARGLRRLRAERDAATPPEQRSVTRRREDEDEALAAYNDYLASLAEQDQQRRRR